VTDTEKIAFKNRLRRWALDHITQRINTSRAAIDQAQEAANNEEYLKELATLHAVNTEQLYTDGRPGAFLRGEGLAFFIAAGLGRHNIDGETIFFLSPHAPLAKALQNLTAGDRITSGQINTTIKEVF